MIIAKSGTLFKWIRVKEHWSLSLSLYRQRLDFSIFSQKICKTVELKVLLKFFLLFTLLTKRLMDNIYTIISIMFMTLAILKMTARGETAMMSREVASSCLSWLTPFCHFSVLTYFYLNRNDVQVAFPRLEVITIWWDICMQGLSLSIRHIISQLPNPRDRIHQKRN
jgi:hypothetical protein